MAVDFFSSLKLATGDFAGQRPRLALAIGLATVSVLLDMLPIWAVYQLIRLTVEGTATGGQFLTYAALMAVSIPLAFFIFGTATRHSHIVAFNLIRDLRMRLARHIARLPMGYFVGMRSGQAKQTIISEPERLELMVAHALPEGTSALINWLVITIWLFVVDWRMALAALVLAPISFFCMGVAIKRSYPDMAEMQRAGEEMNGAVVEHLASIPVVKIFNPSHIDSSETAASISRMAHLQSAMARSYVPMGGTFYALIMANITVILALGVWLLWAEQIDLATMLFFVVLGSNYSTPLMRLFDLFHHFANISLSATAAQKILTSEPQFDSGDMLELAGHDINFEAVDFAYGEDPAVLHSVSFTARAGEVTALVGPSGSGKSTIAALIARLHDVNAGRITLGGQDLRHIGLDQLMAQISFVFQEPFLFSASIAENIRFGRADASEADIRAAAAAAQADGFISELPKGYDTVIGQGHQLLSGGERQRIALARAILKDAPVVVLDEATAFTDPDSEYEIQQALAELTRGKTVIVVAHRLHTIAGADQILVVDQGRIAERGRHEELVAADGLYAGLWHDYTAARGRALRADGEEVSDAF